MSFPFVVAGVAIVGGTQFVERCPYQQENRALFVPRGGVQDGSCHRKPYARRPLSHGVAGEGDGPWLSRSRKHGVERERLVRRQLDRSEEHTSELQSLMRISYAVFCLKKKK